jgi:hypothetical protein
MNVDNGISAGKLSGLRDSIKENMNIQQRG